MSRIQCFRFDDPVVIFAFISIFVCQMSRWKFKGLRIYRGSKFGLLHWLLHMNVLHLLRQGYELGSDNNEQYNLKKHSYRKGHPPRHMVSTAT